MGWENHREIFFPALKVNCSGQARSPIYGRENVQIETIIQALSKIVLHLRLYLCGGFCPSSYRFKPVRRMLVPQEGNSEKRKLAIPVVLDRIVSQRMNLGFDGTFGPDFTASTLSVRGCPSF